MLRQAARDLRLARPGDLEALTSWLMAELRCGAQGIPRSGQRAMFALRIRKSPDKIKRTEVRQCGPSKPKLEETVVHRLLCHPWSTSVRQNHGADCPLWAISIGGLPEGKERGWRGNPGELYLSPVLSRGVYCGVVWYRQNESVLLSSPEALLDYLGPQDHWRRQQRLLDWQFLVPPEERS